MFLFCQRYERMLYDECNILGIQQNLCNPVDNGRYGRRYGEVSGRLLSLSVDWEPDVVNRWVATGADWLASRVQEVLPATTTPTGPRLLCRSGGRAVSSRGLHFGEGRSTLVQPVLGGRLGQYLGLPYPMDRMDSMDKIRSANICVHIVQFVHGGLPPGFWFS